MEDIRWRQRFSNYKSAIFRLDETIDFYVENKDTKDNRIIVVSQIAMIKAFEFTLELSWNLIKDYLEYDGVDNISGSRDAIRKAYSNGIIQDAQEWLNMINDRNLSSHTYNQSVALELSVKIVEKYYFLFKELLETMENR